MSHCPDIRDLEQHALDCLLNVELPLLSLPEPAALPRRIERCGCVLAICNCWINERRLPDDVCRPALIDLKSRCKSAIQRRDSDRGIKPLQAYVVADDRRVHDSISCPDNGIARHLICQ